MKTIAVIAEYDPFHLGHAHLFREIRKTFGEDAAIVAVMSGNYTQRGEPALCGKDVRAAMAVMGGASLVLELPFPYSSAPAEFFATAGVHIANALGVVDVLSFGSESGDTALLKKTAGRLLSPAFREKLLSLAKEKNSLGRAAAYAQAYQSLWNEGADLLLKPNEILGLSYCQALQKSGSPILPHAFRRMGNFAKDCGAEDGHFASASYLREKIKGKYPAEDFEKHIPKTALPLFREAMAAGLCPIDETRFSALILAHFRLFPTPGSAFAEAGGGLYRRIAKSAAQTSSFADLAVMAASAKYTLARVRRAALFSFFEVGPEDIRTPPAFTRVLAMDKTGQALLKRMKHTSAIPVLTKPAHDRKLPSAALEQAARANRADSVYAMLFPAAKRADLYIRTSPFCK